MIDLSFEAKNIREFSADEKACIELVVREADHSVRKPLPQLDPDIDILVRASADVIPETGVTGHSESSSSIVLKLNPEDERGVCDNAKAFIRSTYFHEAHHAVRHNIYKWGDSLAGDAIFEGLGSAFERDFVGSLAPWGDYSQIPEIEVWTRELLALDSDAPRNEYKFQHSDGRRWIMYRVGTYIIDKAMAASSKNSAELVNATVTDILAYAGY